MKQRIGTGSATERSHRRNRYERIEITATVLVSSKKTADINQEEKREEKLAFHFAIDY
jgi:hypothetical protein